MALFEAPFVAIISLPLFVTLSMVASVTCLKSAAASSNSQNSSVVVIDCAAQLIDIKSAILACQTAPCAFHGSHCKSSNSAIDVARTACQYRRYCQLVASNVTLETNCTENVSLNISYECVAGLNDTVLPPVLLNVDNSSVQLRLDANHQTIQRRYVPMSQPCAVSGFLFEGFGYVLLAPDQFIGEKFQHINFFFRTTNPDGILFAAFQNDSSSYVYLALIDGELEFGVKGDGDDNQSIRTHKRWNDNRFYRVEARKTNKEQLLLRVYYGSEKLFEHTEPLKKKGETVTVVVDNSYVGGLPTNSNLLTLLPDSIGFIGCIRVMFLLRSTLEFDSSKIERLVNVVQENGGCPPAVEKAMHFRGSGYVKLNLSSSQINDELRFRFRIRTSWPNGLLLAAFGHTSKDFLFVETRGRDGIDVTYRRNEERVNVIRVNQCVLCDGSWHEIGLSLTKKSFIVRVHNAESKEVSHIVNVTKFASKIFQNVYVGGMPRYDLSETRPTPVEVALGFGVSVTGYGGCLADFSVNEALIDVVKKREESVNVSFAGCPNFPWSGPVCKDELVAINPASGNEEDNTVTDSDVEAFTEYLYRVVVNVSGSGAVFSEWTRVRTGNDSSSSGRFRPEIDYNGINATIQWTGPPTVLNESLYDIDIYTCAVCLNTTISSCYHVEDTTLPHQLKLSSGASLALYTVQITASVLNPAKRLTSNFSTALVTKPKALSRVCECSNGEGVFSFDCNRTKSSNCFSFNTSSCETMLEQSSGLCLNKNASSSPSEICLPPTVTATTGSATNSFSSIIALSSSLVHSSAVSPTTGFATNSLSSVLTTPSSSPMRSSAALNLNPTTETSRSSSSVLDNGYLVATGVGGFLVLIVVGFFFYWKKKRKPAESPNRRSEVVPMPAAFASPFDESKIFPTRNVSYCLPPSLLPPPLPPPNREVYYCEMNCIENRDDDRQLDAVNPLSEHYFPLLDETEPNFTTISTSAFWEPAKTEETISDQLARANVSVLKRQFGTVEKGIWSRNEGSSVVVEVKTLKSETRENRVKFLREAAIMSQFEHNNVIKMYGVVLGSANPIMIVVEILPKGDLKDFLSATRYDETTLKSNLAARFLQMSRDIAAGMAYLAGLSFIHRDLAARNVSLSKNFVCKIADFGLARDFDEENCYMGRISIRWTAPEVLKFFTYSLASDVWSYGVVLYEIWSVGEQPYDCLSNKMVVENLEMGYRLPPPPGCPYAIYKLMIECWHPDYHKRPSFSVVSTCLSEPDDALLINEETSESKIGDCVEESCQTAYLDLQSVYKSQ